MGEIHKGVIHKLRNSLEVGGLLIKALLSQTLVWQFISKMMAKALL